MSVMLLQVALVLLAIARPAFGDGVAPVDVPLARVRVWLRDGATRRVVVHGRWDAPLAVAVTPERDGARLRIAGGPGEGDTGTIILPADRWRRVGPTLRYRDRRGLAEGIQRVVLRTGVRGGMIVIRGRSPNWGYSLARTQTRLAVILSFDTVQVCGELGGAELAQRGTRRLRGQSHVALAACPCAVTFGGTFEAIQQVIFAGHTCTQVICHGAAPGSGGLDLRPANAYRSLIGVPSTYDATRTRVIPGASETSLLWQKLAARTLQLEGVPLSPMPLGDPPLSPAELDAVARWIAAGAPESGSVAGTAELLDVCLSPFQDSLPRRPSFRSDARHTDEESARPSE